MAQPEESAATVPAPAIEATDPLPETQTLSNNPMDGDQIMKVGGFRFYMVFISLMVSIFLSAIDLTSLSTALPTIVHELNGSEFTWVGSSYALSSTAFLPLSGGLAQIFGRRPVLLGSLMLFALGSGLAGGAKNMGMLIGARTVQGIGGGGILSLTEIVISDLVPLRQRGLYMGLIGAIWGIAGAAGPVIGGAFSESNWRWLFYMNLPLSGIAIVFVFIFLRVKTPQSSFSDKMRRMDWIGNTIVIASTTMVILALTWGGTKYSWSSAQVLVLLIVGLTGLAVFVWYEKNIATEPVIPWQLVNNRNSLCGYITTFLHSLVAISTFFYLPAYFQGAKLQSPIGSSVSVFGATFTMAPLAIVCGASIAISGKYRPQNIIGWMILTTAIGLLALLKPDSPKGLYIGLQIVLGFGLGPIYAATRFPILASQPLSENAHAMALFTFFRNFANTWGIVIGSTTIQNQLVKKLPPEFLDSFPANVRKEITYAAIPILPTLQEPLRHQVQVAFADSIRLLWLVLIGVCAVGLLVSLVIKELPMHTKMDEQWGLEENNNAGQIASDKEEVLAEV